MPKSPAEMPIRFPIRLKLMFAMVTFTLVFLISFSWVSMDGFESDKTASIYESILTNNSTLSSLVTSELSAIRERLHVVLSGFNSKSKTFEKLAKTAFTANPNLESVLIYLPDESGRLTPVGRLDRDDQEPTLNPNYNELAQDATTREAALTVSRQTGEWALAVRFFDPTTKKYGAAVAVANQSQFLSSFLPSGRTASFLIDADGRNLLAQTAIMFEAVEPWIKSNPPKNQTNSIQVKKIKSSDESYLVSSAKLGVFGWAVVSAVPEKKATAALSRLFVTLALILVFFVCLAIAASVLIAGGMTANLARLYQAVASISAGNLQTKTNIESSDEIGVLGKGIDRMTARIRELIDETKEKMRMEQELKTAQIVQSTLFPSEPLLLNGSEVRGFCLPATECSGDWWNYHQSGSKIFLAIGDATGHGVPAALVTSAARATMALLSEFENLSISERLTCLNKAIFATTKGQIQMTLFMCSLDTDTGMLTYANASHEQTLHLPWTGQKLKRNQIGVLTESNGHRLGEVADSRYTETTVALQPGDVIAMTTDGISEMFGPSGEMFGERRFLNVLLEGFSSGRQLEPVMDTLKRTMEDFRGATELKDDVTFCLLRYGQAPATDLKFESEAAPTN